ncbi:hypothetical protein [Clostridium thermarum]|uniref:hypothetical protein n=1 Tax=Clostridium thermarum TaxID=1716543 RepID=UPI0013D4B4EF|nr:hypothetical protein [Clostridium thermarum]
MLPKPSIIKLPNATFPIYVGPQGCTNFSDGNRTCIGTTFSCKQYNGMNCEDAHFCLYDLGAGVVVGGAVVGGIIFVIS